MDVKSPPAQMVGVMCSALWRKVAAVFEAAHKRVPPRFRLQGELSCGLDVPDHKGPVQRHVLCVVSIDRKRQGATGEVANLGQHLEALFQELGGFRVML
jgi:hypothetical protein